MVLYHLFHYFADNKLNCIVHTFFCIFVLLARSLSPSPSLSLSFYCLTLSHFLLYLSLYLSLSLSFFLYYFLLKSLSALPLPLIHSLFFFIKIFCRAEAWMISTISNATDAARRELGGFETYAQYLPTGNNAYSSFLY